MGLRGYQGEFSAYGSARTQTRSTESSLRRSSSAPTSRPYSVPDWRSAKVTARTTPYAHHTLRTSSSVAPATPAVTSAYDRPSCA